MKIEKRKTEKNVYFLFDSIFFFFGFFYLPLLLFLGGLFNMDVSFFSKSSAKIKKTVLTFPEKPFASRSGPNLTKVLGAYLGAYLGV